MSKIRKARKLRTPNVPMSIGPTVTLASDADAAPTGSRVSEPAAPIFDYAQTRKDLTRIAILAGSFIAVLVALSFFLR
jgi:hypothetical protein